MDRLNPYRNEAQAQFLLAVSRHALVQFGLLMITAILAGCAKDAAQNPIDSAPTKPVSDPNCVATAKGEICIPRELLVNSGPFGSAICSVSETTLLPTKRTGVENMLKYGLYVGDREGEPVVIAGVCTTIDTRGPQAEIYTLWEHASSVSCINLEGNTCQALEITGKARPETYDDLLINAQDGTVFYLDIK